MSAAEILDPGEPSLAELAATANSEHAATQRTAEQTVEHAIRAGRALAQAQQRVEPGLWYVWLEENFDGSRAWASVHMRMAYYQDRLGEAQDISHARRLLRGLPAVGLTGDAQAKDAERSRARALRDQGLLQREIAELMGVSQYTVSNWLKNRGELIELRRARDRRHAERKRLRRLAEREAALRNAPGGVSALHEDILKLTQKTGKVIDNASSKELRAGLNACLAHLYKAQDEIVKAVGIA